MNMSKRCIYLLPLTFLFLSACTPVYEPEAVFVLPSSAVAGQWQPAFIDMGWEDIPYPYGNVIVGGNSAGAGAPVWDTPESIIMYIHGEKTQYFGRYIKSIGRFEPFCELVACRHFVGDEECMVSGVYGRIDARNGKVYMSRSIKKSLLTTDWITELRGNRLITVAGEVDNFLCGENGFLVFRDGSLLLLPYGSSKPELLLDKFESRAPVVIGDWLYAMQTDSIVRVGLSGGDYAPETVVDGVRGVYFRYYSDGEYLYYIAQRDETEALYRSNLDGTEERLVIAESPLGVITDGEYLYYTVHDPRREKYPVQSAVFRFRLDGVSEAELLCLSDKFIGSLYALPTSPDALLAEIESDVFFVNIVFYRKQAENC
jgi:hypothetical protein